MFKIKRVYEEPSKEDGYRLLVDRLWPRGLTKEAAAIDQWMKEIAPSNGLRQWFAHDPEKWEEFLKRYRAEVEGKKEIINELRNLEKERGTVTLLFGAKDETRNQAVALLSILKGKK